MGVHGLWKLIESSGKPIPPETLENKVLAVDVSIWLHQAIKGFQDSKGAPVANAHLLGIYHRVCKLLYFKIKPVFVFDGGVPALKRQTIEKRNQYKSRNVSEAERLQKQLLSTLLKHSAVSKVLSEKAKASLVLPKKTAGKYDNLYDLPSSTEFDPEISSSDDDQEEKEIIETDSSPTKQWDLHSIDTTSVHFKTLPLEVKHEILTELKETRKQNSWGKLHQLPKQSNDFSSYQMKRLLKRKEVQSALDEVSQEMGGMSLSLAELESLLNDQGVKTNTESNIGKRIASDDNTRYLLIKDIQKELHRVEQGKDANKTEDGDDLKKAIELSLQDTPSTSKSDGNKTNKKSRAALEEEEELERAIQLSLEETHSTFTDSKTSDSSFIESFEDGDSQSDSDGESTNELALRSTESGKKLASAQNYMLEYSGLTPSEIAKILNKNNDSQVNTHEKCHTDRTVESRFEKIPETGKKITNSRIVAVTGDDKSEDMKENNEVEIMSDSGDSSGDDFEISTVQVAKPVLEILVDPDKTEDDDDLFSDIFKKDECNGKNTAEAKLVENEKNEMSKSQDLTDRTSNESDVMFDGHNPIPIHEPCINSKEQFDVRDQVIKNIQDTSSDDEYIKSINELGLGQTTNNSILNDRKNEITQNRSENAIELTVPKLTINEMEDLKDSLQNERIDLIREKSRKERLANNITDQMYQEAQELLELFGVPYLIAPMEAEAQCAFLDEIELTDGSITDDSDIWLFGGRTVYKNFFNQSKYVMEFKAENIEHHFKLNRQQMILLALLVGSDYTNGIQGVGPVTALEILASFPPTQTKEFTLSHHQLSTGLKEFKSWFVKGKAAGPGRSALKNKLKNITFSENFPSFQVIEAYLEPKVETSRERFSWGKPDIIGLTVFAKEKFGWTMKKTEDILNPVIKKLEENQTQKSIKDYFKTNFKVASIDIEGKVSKRVKNAIDKIGKTPDELIAEEMMELEKEKERALKKTRSNVTKKSNSNRTKKKKTVDTNENTEDGDNLEVSSSCDASQESKNAIPEDVKQNTLSKNKKSDVKQSQKVSTEKQGANAIISNESSRKSLRKKRVKKEDTETDEQKSLEDISDLKEYEELAVALKNRRKRKNELMKIKTEQHAKKKLKLPKELNEDEEIKLLATTTSYSEQKVEQIKHEVLKSVEKMSTTKKTPVPIGSLHTKEVIHQKLRDKSNLLRNKLKAIEVFRKSTKGPGYVPKRSKKVLVPKDDACLSEDSD